MSIARCFILRFDTAADYYHLGMMYGKTVAIGYRSDGSTTTIVDEKLTSDHEISTVVKYKEGMDAVIVKYKEGGG